MMLQQKFLQKCSEDGVQHLLGRDLQSWVVLHFLNILKFPDEEIFLRKSTGKDS